MRLVAKSSDLNILHLFFSTLEPISGNFWIFSKHCLAIVAKILQKAMSFNSKFCSFVFFFIPSYLGMVAFFETRARVGMGLPAKSSGFKILLFSFKF